MEKYADDIDWYGWNGEVNDLHVTLLISKIVNGDYESSSNTHFKGVADKKKRVDVMGMYLRACI